MEWITPKTDWAPATGAQYTGDYLNIEDYNRIKNNIEYLAYIGKSIWPVHVKSMPDKEYSEYPYADEINQISDNLESLNEYLNCEIGTKTEYTENGAFIGYQDLNRIESACLQIYEALMHQTTKPRTLPFRMGDPYWPLKNPKIYHPGKTHLPFVFGTRLGGAYYPLKTPATPKPVETRRKRLPFRLGSEYWPFEN